MSDVIWQPFCGAEPPAAVAGDPVVCTLDAGHENAMHYNSELRWWWHGERVC